MAIRRNRSLSSRKRRQSATQKRDFRIEHLEDRRLLAFAVGNVLGDNPDWLPPQGNSTPSAYGFPGVIPEGALETAAGAFDVRSSQLPADGNSLSPEQIQAALALSIGLPNLSYKVDTLLGVPSFVSNSGGYLTQTSAAAAEEIAQGFLVDNAAFFGLTSADTASLDIANQHVSNVSGVEHVYLQQTLNGIDVYNAVSNVSVDDSGRVLVVGNSFAPDVSSSVNRLTPAISATSAIEAAAANLGVSLTEPLAAPASVNPADRSLTYSDGGISRDPIPTKLMVFPTNRGESRLVWNLTVNMTTSSDWYNINIDAETGDVLSRANYTAYESLRVFPQPLEGPADGLHTVVTDPFDPVASPFGWFDTNGASGAEFTITRGNNVWAFPDRDGNTASDGNEPNGGAALNFDFAFDPSASPLTNRDQATVNLFYWNNILHDVLVRSGFDEASGNFQVTNYSGNGLGGDAVQAAAQFGADNGSTDNAFFATPPEGLSPLMGMFEFTQSNPRRDSDNSAVIIVHEYAHGISNRLIGGPNNVSALQGLQSGGMGEGWGDFYGMALTGKVGQSGNTVRTVGNYVLNNSGGIRRLPYSTDMSVNPLTYNDIDPAQIDVTFPPNPPFDPRQNPADQVHNMGEVWASTLWDMYWNLTNRDGFDPDLYTGSGGNKLAITLVTEGMKLTPARPTMLEARDGIVAADVAMNGGANLREIWTAFARRGMGFSALDGGNDNSTAVTEAFDLPPNLPAPGGNISGPSRVPQLLEIQTNDGELLQPGDVLNVAPREFRLLFEGGSNLSEFTLADGVQLVASGGDGDFSNGNEVIVTPGFIGLGDTANELIIRVAEALPDDQYELTVIGSGLRPLTNIAGERFNDGVDETRGFELDLGAQVLSVVPQPIVRDSGGNLVQNKRQVVVYFNNDDLNPADAGNPAFYQLVQTNDTLTENDDVIILPASVTYDAAADTATLEFANDLPDGKFRLQIGVSEERDNRLGLAVRVGSIFSIAGTDFSTNASIGDDIGADDVDLYRFRLEAAATVDITASPSALLNTQLRLFNDAGVELNISDNGAAGAADTLTSLALAAGTYYVGVSSSGNAGYNVLNGSGAAGGATTGGYRLDIDSSLVSSASDDNSSFATATSLGNLGIGGKTVGAALTPQTALVFPGLPGGNAEPGHRQIPVEDHGAGSGIGGGDNTVETLSFFFPVIYGSDPITGAPLTNAITENQKDRTREIFALYGEYLGVDVQETLGGGTSIATGDARALDPTIPPGVSLGGPGAVVIANGNFGDSPYGGGWFGVAFHEIGHSIGLGHSYDIPSIQGSGLPGEPVFPGDNDLVHAKRLHPLVGTDVDLYQFDVTEPGVFSAETLAERRASGDTGLDSVLQLYREVNTPSGVVRELLAQNDDYFSSDPYLNLPLAPGRYYLGVSATGNTNYDPTISDSGFGGTSQGAYDLKIDFAPDTLATLNDATGVALDGDADGAPGGAFNTWFQVGNTIFVDKANDTVAGPNGAGTLADPFDTVSTALAFADSPFNNVDIVRIVGNNLDRPYLIGENNAGLNLADGREFLVPQGVTVMIDAGAVFKLQQAIIDVGSNSITLDRSNGVLQVLGVPESPVVFTSLRDDSIAGDSDGLSGAPAPGDWGGLVFNADSDYEDAGIFLNLVNNADLRYGGGKAFVNSVEDTFSPIFLATARPTISYNTITNSANSAISADPNSFDDVLGRIGPDVYGNRVFDNSINGLFVRVRVGANNVIDKLTVNARFDDNDITHVFTENLVIEGTPGGPLSGVARFDARLAIDPGVTVKLASSRIDVGFGAQLLAEGTPALPVVFTSLADDSYGFGNTFDTNNDGAITTPAPADWSGLLFRQVATGSLDNALVAFGGGTSKLNGQVEEFNAIEIQQADVRIANSTIENNAAGQTNAARNGLRGNRATAIFVRGAQPILVDNIIRNNEGAAISINANAMQATRRPDYGRSTGPADQFQDFADNAGPLVRLNRLADNDLNGMEVRAERVVIDSIWDDTGIVHIVNGDISVGNLHTFGSLRLESSRSESLVVKLAGSTAGFTATGAPGDIDDRIGGTVQIIGQAGRPVILTSLSDDTVGAGFTPNGQAQIDTNGNGPSTGSAGNWRSVRFEKYANDANTALVNEAEASSTDGVDINGAPIEAEFLGELAPDEKSGDDNRRLGFDVNGFISLNDAADVDVYSFTGVAGSRVWIDIDRTSVELDTIVELIDANGAVLARSLDAGNLTGLATTLTATGFLGGDFYTTNPRDAGFEVVLPGNAGDSDTFFVRVRSQPQAGEINDISKGQTRGDYQLGIRLRQDERPSGSTVQLADIRFATNGIELIGLPNQSPLIGESTETRANNDSFAAAQPLGNLLSSDRNTISVGGVLSNANDVDWYKFEVDYDLIQSIGGVNGGPKSFATVFDIDWADGLARPDTILSVFDAQGNLILVSRDSNVQDDRANGGGGPGDLTDLTSGSFGPLDPYIGPVQLPAGSPAGGSSTYYVAISSNARIPTALNSQFESNAAKPNVRLEPINSINRVVDDRIGSVGYTSGSELSGNAPVLPQLPAGGGDAPPILPINGNALSLDTNVIQFTLADVRLFVSQPRRLYTVDPLNGGNVVNVGNLSGGNNGIQDIEIRSDGRLIGYESLFNTANTARQVVQINPDTGASLNANRDSIPNVPVPPPNPPVPSQLTTDMVDAVAFRRTGVGVYGQVFYSVRDGATSRLYSANPTTLSAAPVQNQPWGTRGTIDAGGITGGMAIGNNGMLYGVNNFGSFYSINTGNAQTTLRGSVPGANFVGLALGPQNVNDGAYRNMLFAITQGGDLYAFDTSGNLQPIFNGATSVNVGQGGLTGLAFSPLDFNLWHPTTQRGGDPGHGVTQAFDFSRDDSTAFGATVGDDANGRAVDVDERSGGASFYFGLENFVSNPGNGNYLPYDTNNTQLGILGQREQEDLTSNPSIGGNFNLPGGAKGSLVTNEFSLAGSVGDDLPTLYFTYFLDTQGANSTSAMADSARVSISSDGGANWSLLATNNSVLSTPQTPAELAQFLSTSANGAGAGKTQTQVVQELFDTANWRQARVDLRDYAGQSNITLRFDFSTYGTLNQGLPGDGSGDITNPRGGRDNNFEGFYIDDIVVGYAERGEIVSGDAGGNSLNTVAYNVPENPDLQAPEQALAGAYQLEIRRGTEFIAGEGGAGNPVTAIDALTLVSQGLLQDTNYRFIRENSGLGDRNLPREQGHIQIEGNRISNVTEFGIRVDAGVREAGNSLQFPGGVRNLPGLNAQRLAPGVTLKSNLITFVGQGGIFFSGDPNPGSTPLASVPFGRIVNNTIYGGNQAVGDGILVTENAGPTILNNIISNTATGISVTSSPQTVVVSNLFKDNTANGLVGADAITLSSTDPLFVDPVLENFYLANGSLAVDSSRNTLNERAGIEAVKSIVGISPSTINAPTRDVFGQLRVDDPSVDPLGQGANAFIDMGAVERADFAQPFASLIAPFDNDVEGVDLDPIRTVVQLENGLITRFQILFDDARGLGVDPATISARSIILNRDGKRLIDGVDYTFGFNATSGVIELTPLTAIWLPDSTYTIRLANREVTIATVSDGGNIQDGDSFTITDTAGSPVTFEFESGLSLQIPETLTIEVPLAGGSPGGIVDGDRFTFNFEQFEFDSNGQASSRFVIPFGDGANPSSREEIADAIVVQLQAAGVGVPRNLGDGVVRLGSQAGDFLSTAGAPTLIRGGIAGGVGDGQTFTITNGASLVDPINTPEQIVTFEYENTDVAVPDGVAPGNIAIPFSLADSADEIAIVTGQIVAATAAVELPVAQFVGDGRVHLGGRENTPTRNGHLIDSSLTTVSDFGDAGVLTSLRLNLPGGRDLFVPAAGGQLGGHNGGISDGDTFTIDDGVTRTTFEFDHNGISNPNNTIIAFSPFFTQAQLAISIVVTLQNAPNLNLNPVNLGNGQIFIGGTPAHILTVDSRTLKQPFKPGRLTDGETFTLVEGSSTLTFEFDSDGNVATGNTPVNFATVSTADQIVDEMVRVIGLSGLNVSPRKLGSDFLELGELVGVQVDTTGTSVFATGVSGGTERIDFVPSTTANPAELVATLVVAAIANSPLQGVSPVQDGSQLIFTGVGSIVGLANTTVVGIADNAGNLLAPNQPAGVTSFTVLTPALQLDFGDAPDPSYPTLAASNGARHIITDTPLFLGARVDAETDGQPNAAASGDDAFDIITALSTLTVVFDSNDVQSLQIPENAGVADVNDGDVFQIDNGAVSVAFEFDSDGLTTEGNVVVPFAGGETADQIADLLVAAIGGAGLGVTPTKSANNVLPNNDDEDGVSFLSKFNSFLDTSIEVIASGAGLLNAWIDFNADGDWDDAGEQVFVDEQLASGVNPLTIRTPMGAVAGLTYARFRFSTDAGLLPTGLASDGEVEDYQIDIIPGTPPTVVDDPSPANTPAYTTTENALLTINPAAGVVANDFDPDGDAFSVSSFDALSANGAAVVVNADGSFTYDPDGPLDFLAFGEELFDTFTYTASDVNGLTSTTATATIRVLGRNDAPVAIDNAYATDEETSVIGNALTDNTGLGVDFDLDASNTLTVISINGGALGGGVVLPSGASVTLAANGDFTYDPSNAAFANLLAAGENGVDSFTYSISDGSGGVATATVSLTIQGVNDSPVATDNAYTLDEDSTLAANAILDDTGAGADSDPDASDMLAVTLVNGNAADVGNSVVLASGATLTLNADGSFLYDPTVAMNSLAVGESMADLFTYTISDGLATSRATVSLTITGRNDAPIAFDNAYATDEKTTALGDLVGDDTGDGLDFDPDANDILVVSAVNGVAGNVGGTLSLPSNAQLTVQANGVFAYNPTTSGGFNALGVGESAVETFTYTIDDGNGGASTATATISISGVNDQPIANAKSFVTDENTLFSENIINGGGAADSDIDQSDILSVVAIDGATGAVGREVVLRSGARLTVEADGSFVYDPTTSPALNALPAGQSTSDTFSYTISDGQGGFASETVAIQVTGVNDAPVAVDNTYNVNEDTALSGDLILNNSGNGIDADPEGGLLEISRINGVAISDGDVIVLASGAELTILVNGQFTYSAIPAFDGLSVGETANDDFNYTLIDDQGVESTANVTITITGENDAPVAIDNSYGVNEDVTVIGNMLVDVDATLGADFDVDALDFLVVSAVEGSTAAVGLNITLPSGAKLDTAADGTFEYDPRSSSVFGALAPGETASDSFIYTITDGNGGFSTATVSITVSGVNDGPLATLNIYSTNEDTAVSGNVISEDTGAGADQDPDITDILAVSAINGNTSDVGSTITLPSGAELVVNADGSFTYDPSTSLALNALAVGAPGTDSFIYTIDDGNGGSDTALVAISVTGVNDRPVAGADTASTTTASSVTIAVLANDTDIDGVIDPNSPNVLVVDRLPDFGSLSLNGDGTINYQADSLFVGQDTFQYRVRDDQGALSLPAIVTIDVSQGNPGFTNPRNPADVNDDGNVDLQDVLILINDLRENGNPHVLTPPASGVAPFVDTNGDLSVSTSDIIVVLQALRTQEAEGESAPAGVLDLSPLQYPSTPSTPITLDTPSAVSPSAANLATANLATAEPAASDQAVLPSFGANSPALESSFARYGSSGSRHRLQDLETALDDIADDVSSEWKENSQGDPLGDIDGFLPPA